MMVDTSTTGENIRVVRRQRGITQEELAKMTGLSTMSIRRYESGERIVTDETLIKIGNALQIEWQKLKGLVCWGFDGDGFQVWAPPESETELNQIFADNISKHRSSRKKASDRINAALDKLNLTGQEKAVERVEELTEISRYQKEPQQPPQAPTPQDNETTPEDE